MDKYAYDQTQTQTQGVTTPYGTEKPGSGALTPPVVLKNGNLFYPTQTKPKGNGFWRGCCAGWCCYCCLDACF